MQDLKGNSRTILNGIMALIFRDEIHPPTVCQRCARNLYRLRESASSHSLSEAPFTWEPHRKAAHAYAVVGQRIPEEGKAKRERESIWKMQGVKQQVGRG